MNAKQAKSIRKELRLKGVDISTDAGRAEYKTWKKNMTSPMVPYQDAKYKGLVGIPSAAQKTKFKGFRHVGTDREWGKDIKGVIADFSMTDEKKNSRRIEAMKRAGSFSQFAANR
jgi:hypothetical protein